MSDAIDVNEEHDDLPVLTQVLRIGGGRAAIPGVSEPGEALLGVTESPLDEILLTDQLVIGTEPHQGLEPYVPLTTPLSDEAVGDDEPLAQVMTPSLIVPFMEPVDVPAPSGEGATSDAPIDAVETTPQQGRAANDADDVLPESAMAIEPAPASTDESALVASSTPTPFDYDAFAVRVREAVLNDLLARIDTEFDARIAQTLHAELEAALASLQDNLREQLADAIRDVVRRAVDEQVARLRETRGE